MFQNLSDRLGGIFNTLTGRGRLTEDNIKDALGQVRTALLEADVALPVVEKFMADVSQDAIGQKVISSLTPGDVFVKVVHEELIDILGKTNSELNLKTQPPAIVLSMGLQGSGKTTTVIKLARYLRDYQKKSVLVVSVDVYRPAAAEQLEILANQAEIEVFKSENKNPIKIIKAAIDYAKTKFIDAVIIDSAGRLHIDQPMMEELKEIQKTFSPIESLLVIDSMMGQDAVNVAKTFSEQSNITGIILTKADGDARGGAALSMRVITEKPIKFIGSGEKTDALEPFYPDRIASRILGMGDILTLVEEAEQKIDQKKAAKLAKKLQKGKAFDLEDFREQLMQMRKMGGLQEILSKLPLGGNVGVKKSFDEKLLARMEVIINSMTIKERYFPALIRGSRKQRIASGSGTQVQDINQMLRQFEQMQKMIKRMSGKKMTTLMKNLNQNGALPF
jgi:signal recognition particle subunit SRP54